VRDVLIRGNRFHPSCLTSWYQFGEGIISIDPIIPFYLRPPPKLGRRRRQSVLPSMLY